MNTWKENLFILQAIRACLDLFPNLFNNEWARYRSQFIERLDRLTSAQSHREVSLAVDLLIDELVESPAAELVLDILRESAKQPYSEDPQNQYFRFDVRRTVRDVEIPVAAQNDQTAWESIIGAGQMLAAELQSLSDAPSAVPAGQRRISAWIARTDEDADEPLKRGEVYELDFKVGTPVEASIISGPDSEVPSSDIPEEGLQTKWKVISPAIYLHELVNEIPVTIDRFNKLPQVASFSLLIPKEGDSIIVKLGVELPFEGSNELNIIIYTEHIRRHDGQVEQEIYRQFNIQLPVESESLSSLSMTPETSLVQDEAVYVPAAHLNVHNTHEWTTPPGKLNIAVTGAASAYVIGNAGPFSVDEPAQWYAVAPQVSGPISSVRASAENFRGKWEKYLNDIDPQDLINRLQNFILQYHQQYDWANLNYYADAAHDQSWDAASSSQELFDLAYDGYALYEAFFPPGTSLRTWLDALQPGHRVSISWLPSNGGIPHVPWGLMYRVAPIAGTPIDPMEFLGLRYRVSYTAYLVQAASRALGAVDTSHTATMLYWGQNAQDPTAVEAQWQKSQLASWSTQVFIPSPASTDAPKTQLLQMLTTPTPSPVAVMYFFCQCTVGSGNDPVLRFGDTAQVTDVVRRTELSQAALLDRPIIFANACTTSTSDPYMANELERVFFKRQCRAYIGTEAKVPIPLASRVAYIFFDFFYRKGDEKKPIASGEALAQTRLFLWTHYKNIGGLFYTYINEYQLYMATEKDVLDLKL